LTSLDWQRHNNKLNNGEEIQIRGALGLQYHKKLPRASTLSVNINESHEETSRNYSVSSLRVRRQFFNLHRAEYIDLNLPGSTLVSVESVVNLATAGVIDPIGNYDVDPVFGRINILLLAPDFPDPAAPGIDVEVTYVVGVALTPLAYTTDIHSTSSSLSLLDGRYRFFASYYQEDQDLARASAPAGRMTDTRIFDTRFDTRYKTHRFSLEFNSYESGANRYRFLDGEWYYDRSLRTGNLRLQAKDRYTVYETTAVNNSSYGTNTLTLGASYTQRLISWAHLVLSANYANVQSDSVSRDALYFRTMLRGRINKLLVTFNGTSTFKFNDNETTRDDLLSFELTRFF
jgi:hypothetical protein